MYLDWYFLPVCRLLFSNEPQVQSVVLSFAIVDDRPTRVEDWILPVTEEDPLWPPIDAGGDRWGLEADQVERAERELFAGSAWPNIGDHDLIVAFASHCTDVDDPRHNEPAFSPYAIARRAAGAVALEIVGALRTPWWEDNFNVGRTRFRSTSPSPESVPLRGISREALLATPNARFSHDYTRSLSEKLVQMLRSEAIDPEEMERIREWVEQSRQWQRHLRAAR